MAYNCLFKDKQCVRARRFIFISKLVNMGVINFIHFNNKRRSQICASVLDIEIGLKLSISLIDFFLSFLIGTKCVIFKSSGITPYSKIKRKKRNKYLSMKKLLQFVIIFRETPSFPQKFEDLVNFIVYFNSIILISVASKFP